MGATDFTAIGMGKTAEEAFRSAQQEARHEYGHRGYTGTVAEKQKFVMIPVPAHVTDPVRYADQLLEEGDRRIDDKWGPAGCIKLAPEKFLFFGWASS